MSSPIKDVWWVSWQPRRVLSALPQDRFLVISFLVSAYFGYAKVARKGFFEKFTQGLGSEAIAFLVISALIIFAFLVGAALTKLIARVFGRRMTLIKAMNIQGYCQAPRLLLAVPISAIIAIDPALSNNKILLLVSLGGGVVLIIYSIILWVLSIKWCPKR